MSVGLVIAPLLLALAAGSYERFVKPPTSWPIERRVARVVKQLGERRGLSLEEDNRLIWVARSGLAQVPRVAGDRIELDALRSRAYRLGWTDGELCAVALRVQKTGDLEEALGRELDARLGAMVPTHTGFAARGDGDDTVVLVMFSRRLVQLWPLAAQVRRRQQLVVAGTVIAEGARALEVIVGRPGGKVVRRKVPLQGAEFTTTVDVGAKAGVMLLQLVIERGLGPEVAAQFPVGVAELPREWVGVIPEVEDDGDPGSDAEGLGRRLTALVLGARKAARVGLPAASAQLDGVARAHLDDMRRHGFFAHVSPSAGDLKQRLAARGIKVARALENLARARDAEEVLRQWLTSPAHRANLLDADVDALGVAIEPIGNDEVLAVLVMTRRGL